MIIKRIRVLEPEVANKIAAGEVAERPASVVKELVENSLDAGATAVTVEIRDGGISYIRVTDNGCGIPADDVATAFLRHATSKLSSAEGLDGIDTLGFRGEALASIAAVSHVEMRTRTDDEEHGTRILLSGGKAEECLPCGCPTGTTIEISDLFYNVPARLKFLKSPRGEAAAVGDYLLRLILANSNVSIKFISNGKPVYHSAGDGSLLNAMVCVYGSEAADHVMPVRFDDGYVLISGYCGDEHLARSTRVQQSVFVNGRYIRSQQISYAAQRAYNTRLLVGRFPFFVLNVRISPREVDVNVHPNKLTVKFKDEERIGFAVSAALREALTQKAAVQEDDTKEPMIQNNVSFEEALSAPAARLTQEDLYSIFHNERTEKADRPPVVSDTPKPVIATEIPDPPKAELQFHDSAFAAPAPADAEVANVMTFDFRRKDDEEGYLSEAITFNVSPYKVIGVALDTYIFVEQGDVVFIIDQHAAHERILYERLIANKLRFDSQLLLTKRVITLTPTEFETAMQNMERFNELGFDIEEFGPNSVSVQSIPFGVKNENAERLVRDIIGILERFGSIDELDLVRGQLIQASCKHAIKAGHVLSDSEISEILSYYSDDEAPRTCPHGRPIMVRLSKRELEKMFKRIQ